MKIKSKIMTVEINKEEAGWIATAITYYLSRQGSPTQDYKNKEDARKLGTLCNITTDLERFSK